VHSARDSDLKAHSEKYSPCSVYLATRLVYSHFFNIVLYLLFPSFFFLERFHSAHDLRRQSPAQGAARDTPRLMYWLFCNLCFFGMCTRLMTLTQKAPPGTQLDYTRGVEANPIKPALAYSVAFSPRLLHIVRTKTPRFTIEKPRPETQAFYDLTKCPKGTGDLRTFL
jgi:hypothetical protein